MLLLKQLILVPRTPEMWMLCNSIQGTIALINEGGCPITIIFRKDLSSRLQGIYRYLGIFQNKIYRTILACQMLRTLHCTDFTISMINHKVHKDGSSLFLKFNCLTEKILRVRRKRAWKRKRVQRLTC